MSNKIYIFCKFFLAVGLSMLPHGRGWMQKSSDFGSLEDFLLKLEQPFFEFYSPWCTESADFAVAADYAVAGDNQGQWIFSKCAADGLGSVGSA